MPGRGRSTASFQPLCVGDRDGGRGGAHLPTRPRGEGWPQLRPSQMRVGIGAQRHSHRWPSQSTHPGAGFTSPHHAHLVPTTRGARPLAPNVPLPGPSARTRPSAHRAPHSTPLTARPLTARPLTQAIFEILTSEFSYQHSLGILVAEFRESAELRATMTQVEYHHLFSNILDIQSASQRCGPCPPPRHGGLGAAVWGGGNPTGPDTCRRGPGDS